jgi:hypothetical protein
MHADNFPMPHTSITADKINKFIQSILKDELAPAETKIFKIRCFRIAGKKVTAKKINRRST